MARETNFVDLYRLLDLKPGCDLGDLKQAYRRRVAVLHPDRRGESNDDSVVSERLQHLIALYSSAIEFERRHGRLPGALHTRPTPSIDTDSMANRVDVPATKATRSGSRRLWAVAIIVLIASWIIWSPPWETSGVDADAATHTTASGMADMSEERVDPAAIGTIRIGTSTDAVRALEGEPLIINKNRWEYGPSWIYFQGDTVVDWYSSPLHPLETASTHPQSNDK